jgi:hypothetical protein
MKILLLTKKLVRSLSFQVQQGRKIIYQTEGEVTE